MIDVNGNSRIVHQQDQLVFLEPFEPRGHLAAVIHLDLEIAVRCECHHVLQADFELAGILGFDGDLVRCDLADFPGNDVTVFHDQLVRLCQRWQKQQQESK